MDDTGLSFGVIVFYLIVIAVYAFIFWRFFEKAGKPGWASLIPIYNVVVMLEIAERPWWWIILCLVPIVNIIFLVMIYHDFSTHFGQGVGFTVGLLFLTPFFLAYLAFADVHYTPTGRLSQ